MRKTFVGVQCGCRFLKIKAGIGVCIRDHNDNFVKAKMVSMSSLPVKEGKA
jgi:hypothetical protein